MKNILDYYLVKQAEIPKIAPLMSLLAPAMLLGGIGGGALGYFRNKKNPILRRDPERDVFVLEQDYPIKETLTGALLGALLSGGLATGATYGLHNLYKIDNLNNK